MRYETNKTNKSLIDNIKRIVSESRKNIAKSVNRQLVETYWNIGREIAKNEKISSIDSKSARQQILELSKILTNEIGKGFSRSNLFNMRKFHLTYPDVQTVSGQLSWSHICELLTIEDQNKRTFYEKECINSAWSFRELKRQIESSLFERLLPSSNKTNENKVIELSQKGQVLDSVSDIIKSPYVFEFLGIPDKKPILEKDLEKRLIRHIEDFLL
jgi:hypothetical protein